MLRHWFFQRTVVPVLLLVLAGCSMSNGGTSQDVHSEGSDDTIDCPDGLVLYEEQGICAPYIPECEAWERPTVEGECVVVGPRACPKSWDPNADVDCEPGELLPCKEGFVLTEDEVACVPHFDDDCGENEIPVLGGGCQKIGPQWGEGEEPYFDDCGGGFLALAGGGCAVVGPRACPKLWDPDADVDCVAGDVLPCPEGWMEGKGGLYCEPVYDDCGHGDRPVLGGGCQRVISLPEGCPQGPFPEMPDDTDEILYVLAGSPCTDGCGTEAAPYASIQAAIDAAAPGSAVLVGSGTYDEGLTIEKSIKVLGLCASLVEVTGKALVLSDGDSKVLEAGLGIYDTSGVHLAGLRILSPTAGIAIVSAEEIELHDLEIKESHGVGLYVDSKSQVVGSDLWIHDTQLGSGGMGLGRGAWVGGSSSLNLQRVAIERVLRSGIEIREEGTSAGLTDCIVQDTKSDNSGNWGLGIMVLQGAAAVVTGSVILGNHIMGIGAWDEGTAVNLSSTVIRDTEPNPSGEAGYGVQVYSGASVSVYGSVIEENSATGVAVSNPGTQITLRGTVVHSTNPDGNGQHGYGMQVAGGASAELLGCMVEDNTYIGIVAYDLGTTVNLSSTLVQNTRPNDSDQLGRGIEVHSGASGTALNCLFEGNTETGVWVAHEDSQMHLFETTIRDTELGGSLDVGRGIVTEQGGTTVVECCLFEGNAETSVSAAGPNTYLELTGTVVRNTEPGVDGAFGRGLLVNGEAVAVAVGCLFTANFGAGIVAWNSSTRFDLADTVVRETKPNSDGGYGFGMIVSDGPLTTVSNCLFEENTSAGILVAEDETELDMSSTIVRHTKSNDKGNGGVGFVAQKGASVTISECMFDGNQEVGLWAEDPGTGIDISGTTVGNTGDSCDFDPDGGELLQRGLPPGGAVVTMSASARTFSQRA